MEDDSERATTISSVSTTVTIPHNPSLSDFRQEEMNNLLQDVRSVYTFVEPEALSRSYSLALEQAIGRRQNDFAVSTLTS